MSELSWQSSPADLVEAMNRAGTRRACFVATPRSSEPGGGLEASHAFFEEVALSVAQDRRDHRGHRGAFFEIGQESGHLLTAFVHKTRRGQAAGGVRFWSYATLEALIRDGLRLSRGMGHKNALAGLWWGGGKGVIARQPEVDHRDEELRARVYRDYGRFITGLRGVYVTAEDAGTRAEDMRQVFATTRHTTCIPPELGGSGNPSVLTAQGVVVAMEAALEATGRGTLEGKTIASEGLGNVARHMVGPLLERGVARIVASDVDAHAVEEARRMHPDERLEARLVQPGDDRLLAEACDLLAPNAIGATLNPRSIPTLRAAIVCGAANNQLEDPERDAAALAERGLLYVPDFLANRMGIVNCANEQYGSFDGDPAIADHLSRDSKTGIFQRTLEVLRLAEASGRPPAVEAERLADELAEEPHPIWGDRGAAIIDALIRDGWANG